mgnify:CR=1 FL=1
MSTGAKFQPVLVENQTELDNLPVVAGQFIVVKETGNQFVDLQDRRISVGSSGGGRLFEHWCY